MSNDVYFQDIVPPRDPRKRVAVKAEPDPRPDVHDASADNETIPEMPSPDERDRSIRNISITRERPRVDAGRYDAPPPSRRRRSGISRYWLWFIALVALALLGAALLVALRGTRVTIVPRSHTVAFDQTVQFTAYPAATAATGTLAYTVQTTDFDDSEPVPATGTVHAEDKASGSVTVYNDFSSSPIKLIATTRFESADGKIFRAPAAVIVPGKTSAGPGSVTVTIVADQPGDQYNVTAGKFTIPGLKSAGAEYDKVYAMSTAPMNGGFVGDRPNADQATISQAVASIRGRLEEKARQAAVDSGSNDAVVFPNLVSITYSDEPTTMQGQNAVIHEKAHVSVPIFDRANFAAAIAQSVAADAEGASIDFLPGSDFAAHASTTDLVLGTDALNFTLSGTGTLVWQVDTDALAKALAGKDRGAFQTIALGFSGVQSGTARIEPFWSNTFPSNPKAISIVVQAPRAQ